MKSKNTQKNPRIVAKCSSKEKTVHEIMYSTVIFLQGSNVFVCEEESQYAVERLTLD